MKARIVTFVRAYNYGAVLQCFALSRYLSKQGVDVEVLDYFPPYFKSLYNMSKEAPLLSGFRPCRRWLLKVYARLVAWVRNYRFERFIKKFIPIGRKQYTSLDQLEKMSSNCDCYITGSDQVWSPYCAQFDPVFFLDFPDAIEKPRYSYAASFGTRSIPGTMKTKYVNRLSGYQKYSVRENTGAEIIKELLEREAQVCCDPTLLLSPDEWAEIALADKEKEPYILVYYVTETQKLQKFAQRLEKEKKMKVICVPTAMLLEYLTGRIDRCYGFDVRKSSAPEKLLALFRDAEYVLTNSFHGTVFSILFHKQFLVQTDFGWAKNTRATELMGTLGICGRELGENLESIDDPLYWERIDEKREQMRAFAEQYLREIVETGGEERIGGN